ncbi:hypothetical protein CU098_009556, partial [Rhizopus stolonifer]
DYNPYSSLDDDIEDESNFYNDRYGEDDSVYSYDAEAEWEESKQQLLSLFSMVIFPFAGKWLGKKLSFWVWAKYMNRVPLSSRYGTIKQLTI